MALALERLKLQNNRQKKRSDDLEPQVPWLSSSLPRVLEEINRMVCCLVALCQWEANISQVRNTCEVHQICKWNRLLSNCCGARGKVPKRPGEKRNWLLVGMVLFPLGVRTSQKNGLFWPAVGILNKHSLYSHCINHMWGEGGGDFSRVFHVCGSKGRSLTKDIPMYHCRLGVVVLRISPPPPTHYLLQ